MREGLLLAQQRLTVRGLRSWQFLTRRIPRKTVTVKAFAPPETFASQYD